MKYQQGKIKTEHNILSEFKKILKKIEAIEQIQRIIPGRISRKQKSTSDLNITFSYFTNAGLKYKLKKGGTAQELFIVCKQYNKQTVYEKIKNLIVDL